MEFLRNGAVCLTGVTDPEILTPFLSFLSSRSLRVVPWSPRCLAVIVGESESSYKRQRAVGLGIPIVTVSSCLAHYVPPPSDLWVERYKPTCSGDVIGHKEVIASLLAWLRDWDSVPSLPRVALVTGPPGIGKTTLVHLVGAEAGYEVVEFNASDERSAIAVRRMFETASQSGCVGSKRLVIMDEVDGMSSGDRGGVGELARLAKQCTFPIICIANDRGSPKMRPLASCSLDVRCSRPVKSTIAKTLMNVVKKEGLAFTAKDLETLCEKNGNDIRSLLNFLQFGGSGGKKDESLRLDAFSATGRVFGTGTFDTKLEAVFVDIGMVPLMVAEGYVGAAGRGADGIYRCAEAGTSLGQHDILDRRIRQAQAWGLLPASVASVVACATQAGGPAPFQIFPSWLGKQSKTTRHRRLMREMRGRGRFSGTEALLDARSLLRARLFRPGLGGAEIVDELLELGLTRDDMMETLVDTVFTGDEDSVRMDTKTKGAVTREWKKREGDRSAPNKTPGEEVVADDSEEEGDFE